MPIDSEYYYYYYYHHHSHPNYFHQHHIYANNNTNVHQIIKPAESNHQQQQQRQRKYLHFKNSTEYNNKISIFFNRLRQRPADRRLFFSFNQLLLSLVAPRLMRYQFDMMCYPNCFVNYLCQHLQIQ
ncbi:hypothetical protein BLA29_003063 [Euroglyphus maynei]|uniref:Uncharacterized protein n=1 Tax=Euroglyphus maynei TaxID=6958 RepID=A0A1Y3B444_EURMA|nr:hypothetical protein BLA29_003063 [Euroglyphus maynei]